jgi:hypothetical protein
VIYLCQRGFKCHIYKGEADRTGKLSPLSHPSLLVWRKDSFRLTAKASAALALDFCVAWRIPLTGREALETNASPLSWDEWRCKVEPSSQRK